MAELSALILQLESPDPVLREAAAAEFYASGCALAESVVSAWRADPALAALLVGPPTVGIAVQPEIFERIRTGLGSPRLAEVPADQDAREFELELGAARLDILTTHGTPGAIAAFLDKFGEGIQQVEYPVSNVERATERLRARFGLQPVYLQTRPGADGTRVNFFLVPTPAGNKVLIELVEPAHR